MYRFFLFVKKVYVLLLFIILEVTALHFYANSTSYTKARLLPISNNVVVSLYGWSSDVASYFSLKSENEILLSELTTLKNQLERSITQLEATDTISFVKDDIDYIYTSAKIVNNTITRQRNYITLDKGTNDGVEKNMAIISVEGYVVGYVVECSEAFSLGISILNRDFKSSGKVGDSDWYGPIFWKGISHESITLSDIPKYADLNLGDTIYTTTFSSIFPADVKIGVVEDYNLNELMFYDVEVKLFVNMAAVRKVFLVKYNNIEERISLEKKYNNI